MTVLETDPTPVSPVVELAHVGPGPQRRVTVGFRVILLIPHWFWLGLVGFVAYFAAIGAWFAALFTGRVPAGLHEFIGNYARYATRVFAYGGLLTDRYPSFSLAPDEDYPFEAIVPPPGRLNRAAVFFRIILVIPAWIVATLSSAGLLLAMFFFWLIVLISGRQRRTLYEATVAVLRYYIRFLAFSMLLTSEFPHRLFGDKAPADTPISEPVDADALALAAPPTGTPVEAGSAPEHSTRLVLSKGAKRLVVLFIVLGVLDYVGTFAAAGISSSSGNASATHLEREHDVLETAVNEFVATTQSCGISGGPDCVHGADRDFANALTAFRSELRATSYPRSVLGFARTVEDDATALIDLLHSLATTSDVEEYQQLAGRFQPLANTFDDDYKTLILTLQLGF